MIWLFVVSYLVIVLFGGASLGWWLGRPTEPPKPKPRIRLKAPVVPKPPVTPAPAPMMLARGRVSIAADGSRIFVDGMGMVEVNDAELRRRAVRVVEQLVALARMQPAAPATFAPLLPANPAALPFSEAVKLTANPAAPQSPEAVQLRELNWWHDHYDAKRRDLLEGCPGRTPPTQDELDDILAKIVELESALPPHLRTQRYNREQS